MSSSGLINVGNTCAINSIIQCIFYTLGDINEVSEKCIFTKSLYILLCLMKENATKKIKPLKFINDLYKSSSDLFKKGEQIDVSELWTFITNKVFEEIGILNIENENIFNSNIHKKAYEQIKLHNNNKTSYWNEIYQGTTITIIKCMKCGEKYYNFETFYNLSVDINKESIIDSLINFFTPIENEDDWKCEKCNEKTKYIKTVKVWKFPKVLVISLNRFDNKMNKIDKNININKILNLKKGVHLQNKSYVYKLKAAIHHMGTYNHGHYIASIIGNENITIYDDSEKKIIEKNEEYYNSKYIYMVYYTLQ